MSIRSATNVAIERSILAAARAHARIPGVDAARSMELARKLDRQMADYKTGECVIALAVQLLRSLGVTDAADPSRLLS